MLTTPLKLSTPAATALGHWMMLGHSSTMNPLIRAAGERMLKPYGVDYAWLNYDAFSRPLGGQSELILVGPKLNQQAALKHPELAALWAPVLDASSCVSVLIESPFSITLLFDETAGTEEIRQRFREHLEAGLELSLNAHYSAFTEALETTLDLCMAALVQEDPEAVATFLRHPPALIDLVVSRVSQNS